MGTHCGVQLIFSRARSRILEILQLEHQHTNHHSPDSLVNVVVDNRQVEKVTVGLLQTVALLSKPLQRTVIVLKYMIMG